MAQTIGFNSGSEAGSNWSNDANAWDGSTGTASTREIAKNTSKETSKWIKVSTPDDTCQTGTISKVEIGVNAKQSGSSMNVYLVPIFGGSTDGSEYSQALTTSATTYWKDITSDGNGPGSSSWTQSHVNNLDIKAYGSNSSFSSARTISIYEFYIRVTFSVSNPRSSKKLYYKTIEVYDTSLESDDFDNATESGSRWTDEDEPGASSVFQNSRLEQSIPQDADELKAVVSQTRQSYSSDFDVSVKIVSFSSTNGGFVLQFGYGNTFCVIQGVSTTLFGYVGFSSSNNVSMPSTPFWIRGIYVNSVLTLYYSTNGTSWTTIISDSFSFTSVDSKISLITVGDNVGTTTVYWDDFVSAGEVENTVEHDLYTTTNGLTDYVAVNDGTTTLYCEVVSGEGTGSNPTTLRVRTDGSTKYTFQSTNSGIVG